MGNHSKSLNTKVKSIVCTKSGKEIKVFDTVHEILDNLDSALKKAFPFISVTEYTVYEDVRAVFLMCDSIESVTSIDV